MEEQFFSAKSLALSSNFHIGSIHKIQDPEQVIEKNFLFARYERAAVRKINRLRQRAGIQQEQQNQTGIVSPLVHQYDYKEFSSQPRIKFSGPSLLLLGPILVCVNLSIAQMQDIGMAQFVFFTAFITFMFNHSFVLRKNKLLPYLPDRKDDNRLKLASFLFVAAIGFAIFYDWSASGGILVAIVWQYLSGSQGCFYLVIFGGVIFSSVTMEFDSYTDFFLKIVSSVLFGVGQYLIHGLKKNNLYVIVNQISLTVMVFSSLLFVCMEMKSLSAWQYLVLTFLGFSVYFNLLLITKMMQSERVSMAMGVTSGIILISITDFEEVSDYYASLAIVLSILVLFKIEYLDKEEGIKKK